MPVAYQEVHLEVTSRCNFHCPFCPLPVSKRAKGVLPLEQAREALGQIAADKLAPRIAYHLMGEPLLYPPMAQLLAQANALGLINRVVSNGYLLAWPKPRRALAHCQILDISLRASDEKEFAELSSQGSYPAYLAGLKDFLGSRQEMGSFQTRLRMFHSPNLAGVLAALGLTPPSVPLDPGRKAKLELAPDITLIIEPRLDWRGGNKPFPARPLAACSEFDQGFAVLCDGSITTCCWDYEGHNILGNFLTDGGIKAVLDSAQARRFRQSFARKRPPTDFCAQCLGRPSLPKYLAYQAAVWLGKR
ncbi:MAG: hypothetical protein C0405_15170 [Desulfovibrio sp.]|nr:hypothetical protein [Desulfovibrio sp.]